jgi:hypothetical protein
MRNHITVSLLALLLIGGPNVDAGAKKAAAPARMAKVAGTPVYTYININNISTVLRNDGTADIDPPQTNSGFAFPKGSGKTAIYESGFLWAARVAGDPQVRVGGSAYSSGLQPGKMLGPGVSEDPNLPKNRIYRVRPDYRTADLSSELRDEGGTEAGIRAQYELDWNEWPAADGAPYADIDGNGQYNPSVDIPGVRNASQTVWFVANDNNSTNVSDLYGSLPLGVELQTTVWAYAQEGALNNMIFKSYLLINRSMTQFDSMYVCQWADPDLGFARDDLAGCDTSLSLGFVYNANNVDQVYGNLPPPAAGFDFFQGPRVPDAASSAVFRGKKISGYRNLPMTSFFYFINSDPLLTDPTQGDPSGASQFYNFMRGRIGLTGEMFRDPQGLASPFALNGDPVTGKGWLDGQQYGAEDRRIGLSSGPFMMAPGDTQEIVVAELAAGAIPGVDRISAISLLKFFDKAAQLTYDNLFQVPLPPPSPKVAKSELDREIVLDWGEDAAAARATETSKNSGFTFQGYNVYQLPNASATLSEARRVAVYDVAGDGVTRITDQVFDPSSAVVTPKVVQFGTDSGVKRSVDIKSDAIKAGLPLVNGVRYYFAVTAYSYSSDPNAVPNNLESTPQIVTVVPHANNPGVRLAAMPGDTIRVSNTGPGAHGDGSAVVQVIDPLRTTGHQYKISFEGTPGNPTWKLTDLTTGTVRLSGQTNQTGNDASPTVDGMIVRVFGPPQGFKTFIVPANASGKLAVPQAGAFGFNGSGFPLGTPLPDGTDRPDGTLQQSSGLAANQGWGIHTGVNASGMSSNYAFFVNRVTQNGARWPLIVPYDFELRFTAAGGYALFPTAFGSGRDSLVHVPFELWNIGINTPDDPSDDYRMFPNILDVDGNYDFNLLTQTGVDSVDNGSGEHIATHPISGGDNDPFTDWIYWAQPENTAAGQAGYEAIVAGAQAAIAAGEDPYLGTGTAGTDVLRRMVLVGWNFGSVSGGSYPQHSPESGTVFRVVSTKINTPNDEFTFSAPVSSQSVALAKEDVRAINVFPNPYYGVNTEEINKYNRFVTFTHLPQSAIIKIFSLAGVQVKEIVKNSEGQFERWDLTNTSGLPVGSGLYVAHIEMPGLDHAVKILKIAIIQEQQILDRF